MQNLKRYTKGETFNAVKHYLSSQDAYTLHKQRRLRFPRRKTISKGISDLYQADLVDLSALSRYNDKYRYLLTVIDVFSKVSWVVPLKSKNANFVTAAFEKSTDVSTYAGYAADRLGHRVHKQSIPGDVATT